MIMNLELAETLEKSEINYMIDRMEAIKDQDGNPEGIEITHFGGCVAFYSRTMPWSLFNNVKGSIGADILNDLIDFYSKKNRKFEIQIIPSKASQQMLRLLHNKGYYQSGFHTTLYCESSRLELHNNDEFHIRELREDEFDIYAEIHCLGTGLNLDGKPYVAANNKVLYLRPGWRFYIGYYHSKPVAVAVMHMLDNVASLTFAATLPEYRNLGFQTNLLKRRIQDAYINNCKLVVGQCTYCSQSHRNMERVGMKIGYTRSTWTQI